MRAITATIPSINIEPYPISLASGSSLSICLDVVLELTREWKPEIAPQATVTNKNGNRVFPPILKPLKAANSIAGLFITIPSRAPIMIPYSRNEHK